jgi:hypothetical protein
MLFLYGIIYTSYKWLNYQEMAMKNWFIVITLTLLSVGAEAASIRLPAIFAGLTVTKDMVKTIPGKDGATLVAIRVTVPPSAPPTTSPMDGYREDMWSSGQLRAGNHLVGSPLKLTSEQAYKTLFCLVNKDELGFQCKSTAEIMSAPRTKPWWIPVVVLPQAEVGRFTTMLTSGPIPASVTQAPQAQRYLGVAPPPPMPNPGTLIPWSDAGAK